MNWSKEKSLFCLSVLHTNLERIDECVWLNHIYTWFRSRIFLPYNQIMFLRFTLGTRFMVAHHLVELISFSIEQVWDSKNQFAFDHTPIEAHWVDHMQIDYELFSRIIIPRSFSSLLEDFFLYRTSFFRRWSMTFSFRLEKCRWRPSSSCSNFDNVKDNDEKNKRRLKRDRELKLSINLIFYLSIVEVFQSIIDVRYS